MLITIMSCMNHFNIHTSYYHKAPHTITKSELKLVDDKTTFIQNCKGRFLIRLACVDYSDYFDHLNV